MPNDIESRRTKRKRDAIRSVAVFGILQVGFIVVCLGLLGRVPGLPGWVWFFLTVVAILSFLPLIGAVMVLRQRLREIEGGELDDAGKY